MVTGSGQKVFSDIFALDHIVRHTGIIHGRNLIIDHLREAFARDHEYRYVADIFGYPKTPSHLGLAPDAGLTDTTTTRILIAGFHRYVQSYLPVISVRQTSSSYKPISFNQNRFTLSYEYQRQEDGYGNVDFIKVPSKYIFAGAWEQNFEIKVTSNSQEDTASIADIVMITLQATYRNSLERNGLFIKKISASGENAESVNSNDPVFSVSISAETYSEWRREIPISNVLDRIRLCFSVNLLGKGPTANNLGFQIKIDE